VRIGAHIISVLEKGDGGGGGTYEVFELTARLLDDAVLAADDDAHAAQVANLCAAYDERVDVEPASREDPRYAREHAGLVLHETVQHVPVWGRGGKKE